MAKKTLPSYHPAFTAPRRAVGRVVRDGCLNWSRPFVYTCVSFGQLAKHVVLDFGIRYGPMPIRHARRLQR